MSGPLPKDPALRQRRNKSATAAKLTLAPSGVEVPELPERLDEDGAPIEWHERTLAWWDDVWTSPMAPEFLKADWHGLFMLAELEDAFHDAGIRGKIELAKEIRLQRAMFGLTPMDRRRLQWEVERTEAEVDKGRRRRRSGSEGDADEVSRKRAAKDPRALLGG
jgi:hypothetical protein